MVTLAGRSLIAHRRRANTEDRTRYLRSRRASALDTERRTRFALRADVRDERLGDDAAWPLARD
jgi:hypothetical protein